jgi:hydroxyacylglutathione hydrolase
MTIQSFTVNPFQQNTYVCHHNGTGVLVDAGSLTPQERQKILQYIETAKINIVRLLLTHGHIDHFLDCAFFAEHFKLDWEMHPADLPMIEHALDTANRYGVEIVQPPVPKALNEGDIVAFADCEWQIFHCPGHSPGSLCFYDAQNGFLIGGDVLFAGSVGRTDLWQGNTDDLIASIKTKLLTLPAETIVYSGHGRATTIGKEKATNPFLT